MSNKNPKAKRLAAAYGLRYAEALNVMREDSDLTEELAIELEISRAEAERRIEEQYAAARQRADESAVSFRTALAEIRSEQASNFMFEALAKAAPSVKEMLRAEIASLCKGLAGEMVEVPGEDDLYVPGLNFSDVELPRDLVDEISVQNVEPDLDTLDWNPAEAYEGGTEVGTAEIRARVTLDGFMFKHDTYGDRGVEIWTFDWNERKSYIGFEREVVLEFEVTVQPGMSIDNLELVGAKDV
ncbi:hypothetical protein ABZ738_28040 [Micromonospora sp. NPDC047793]|uniref:hypothetical protein n=1 Tax=Micromonospora sp. NPDC047793 TaxID=3154342 RepID=UPI00340BD750